MRRLGHIGWAVGVWGLGWLLVAAGVGCEVAGYAAHVVAGGQTVVVEAQYRGLENRSVAVLVAADEYTYFANPGVPAAIGQAVGKRLARGVAGVKVLDPKQSERYQAEHPYWFTEPYTQTLKGLQVERLVVIDLGEYRTHDLGDPYVFRGYASGRVGVAEAGSSRPNDLAYSDTVEVRYPPESSVGAVSGHEAEQSRAMVELLAEKIGWLFIDHEEPKQ